MKIKDYFKRIKNFYEVLENEKVEKIIQTELDYEVVSINKVSELDCVYYFSGKVMKDEEAFMITIMLSSNDNFKNLTIRKEGIDTPEFMLLDVVYTIEKDTSFIQVQKGSLQREHYYVEHLITNGSCGSYQSELYDYNLVKNLITERNKSMYFMTSLKEYSLDHLTIDNACCDEVNEYKIIHNGKTKYITSDCLEKTVEDLLSYDAHIVLCLK